MHPTPPPQPESTTREPLLISRSTIVILLSYQVGQLLGNGVPANFSAILYLAVAVSVSAYLGYLLIRAERNRRRQQNKHQRIAQRVDRRLRSYIIDPAATAPRAPRQPRLRADADFVPVVSDWA